MKDLLERLQDDFEVQLQKCLQKEHEDEEYDEEEDEQEYGGMEL